MFNFFSKINKDTNEGIFTVSTTVSDVLKPALIDGVYYGLKDKLVDELFRRIYPEVEEGLKVQIPSIVKQLSEDIITDLRRNVFKVERSK